uniref:1-deoxy-D-xylulose-5-phosphate synthase n=1 Tax=Aquilaria sinensis TaxID=210372 RepID=K4JBT7_9ROSI|nr:1-deoxy-D-xylulose-5-phosphate synthase 3 [Aquilaria sinensis]
MGTAPATQYPHGIGGHFHGKFAYRADVSSSIFPSRLEIPKYKSQFSNPKILANRTYALPDCDGFFGEKVPTPLLDVVESPIHLKNLSIKELRQLADEIRLELSSIIPKTQKSIKSSLAAVELTVAIHHVFQAPVDKILWDSVEQTHAHKILTGRRSCLNSLTKTSNLPSFASQSENEYDPFGAGHGCSSISAGLGMAAARDIKGKRERVVTVINNDTTMAGQVYEAMSNAGYLDCNMVVILNDSRHSLHPKIEEGPKTSINMLSSTLSKIQSSKSFRTFREVAKGVTKRIGRGMHEWAAKVDEYARGMIGPQGSTLFEELGLYYIGPVDGHNIEDLVGVLQEVASLDSTGPVLVHVITEENEASNIDQKKTQGMQQEGSTSSCSFLSTDHCRTYSDCFVEALLMEAVRDKDIVVVHAGMGLEPSLHLYQERFPDKFFDVGMAEQHAVTFAAGLSRGGLKPFCIIPSTFLQRAYDQVVHDVDRQMIPVRFVVTGAGLVGSDGPLQSGAFDITFMSCLPNMIVMAPSSEEELARMVATAAQIDDQPICFRYPRGAVVGTECYFPSGIPLQIGEGKLLIEGKDVALLGYGAMVQNCLKAQILLSKLGVDVTVADARFCKPLDIELLRKLCENHDILITVEEGSIGGFGSHVAQFLALDGLLDGRLKWRPIVLPDKYIEQALPGEQLEDAGLTGHHIAATALTLLGRNREALQLMR